MKRTKPLQMGGVMRCCIESINEHDDSQDQTGEVVQCNHCSSSLILNHKGIWIWNVQDSPPLKGNKQ